MAGRMAFSEPDEPETGQAETGRRPGRRRRWLVAGAVVTLSVAVGGALYADLSNRDTGITDPLVERTGAPAPPFSLPELGAPGRTVSLADFQGKPLVINFWASWCFPCQTEMPLLEQAYRSAHGTVQFLGIDTDDTKRAAISFTARLHVTYPSLFMPTRGAITVSYGLIGLPITIFISRSGTMLGRHIGQLNAATLHAALVMAFGTGLAKRE